MADGQPGRAARLAEAAAAAPARAQARRRVALLDRIPASTPLELRDRALFELAYACGLRAEELVNLDVGSLDFDAEQVRVEGKGGKTRFVPVGEHALARAGPLAGARPRRARRRHGGARAVPLQERPAALDLRRPPPPADVGAPRRDPGRGPPARPAALVRDPSARGRRRSARDPGAARARFDLDDPGLHSGRVRAPARGVRTQPSPGLSFKERAGDQRQSDRAEGPVADVQGAPGPTARASSSSSPTRRWSSTSPAGCPPACRRTSRRPTSSPTA